MSAEQAPSFEVLVASVRNGDEDAVRVFMGRYEPMLRRVLRVTRVIRDLQSVTDSQDVVQSVFIQAVEDIRAGTVQFSDEAGLEGYLRTVGRNRLRDRIRRLRALRRGRSRTAALEPEVLAQAADPTPTPSEILAAREQVEQVRNNTDPDDLTVLQARSEGVAWEELAAECNATPEAMRKRIERVRRRLREQLGE
jgi:RNA polymerase sigma factor (sigma-70 family)